MPVSSQVLYIHMDLSLVNRALPPGNPKIIQLNHLPKIKSLFFDSDFDILQSKFCSQSNVFLLSPKLFISDSGQSLRSSLLNKVYSVSSLEDFNFSDVPSDSTICILGLETEWVEDLASTRIMVNRIRECPGVSLKYLHVNSRANSTVPHL